MPTDSHQQLGRIRDRIDPLRSELLNHELYLHINSIERLHVFMQHHVFAVWDFMSLLKALQDKICGVTVPWLPAANVTSLRLVNEIVLGEESESEEDGSFASHFDIYHRSMIKAGASTLGIDAFLDALRAGLSVSAALTHTNTPSCIAEFTLHTFEVVKRDNACEIAATLTYGREDLLPDVFRRLVDTLNREITCRLDEFQYYLTRHIEVDADHHGPMAQRLIASLCGEDSRNWKTAEDAAIRSLEARRQLWDGICESTLKHPGTVTS